MQLVRKQRTASIKYKDGHYGALSFGFDELDKLEELLNRDIENIEDVTIYDMFDIPILLHRP